MDKKVSKLCLTEIIAYKALSLTVFFLKVNESSSL